MLFEDARPGGDGGRLFTHPSETIVAHTLADVAPALARVRAGLQRGLYAAGWLTYEAGLAFEPRLAARAKPARAPLLWFGLFERADSITREELARELPDPEGAWISPPRPRMTRADYDAAFARTQRYIAEGDVYQINLSYRADVTILGHPLAAYARLRGAGRGGWSGVAYNGASWLLSTSPELFFRLSSDGAIEARPMKGTAKRRADPLEDQAAAERLREDPKERAENVMIVDLLRNDISKLAKRGSVRVPELFAVETYPTLHTLTSTVRGEIKDEYDVVDVISALFPCGSITGAPKIRAMEIIQELEQDSRGAYTGSIGWMAPDGSAEFNVAIRTIALDGEQGHVGLGAAVVSDSTADGEWEECLTKGAFISSTTQQFDLIETMGVASAEGIARLDLHLQRLERSASVFRYPFDPAAIRAKLASAPPREPCVVRLLLARSGDCRVELKPLPVFAHAPIVRLARLPVSADDFRLRHKTTLRDFYDAARGDADEVVFVDQAGFITEGSFTNVFVAREGHLLTPPTMRGLLPGVLRAELLATGEARECDLRPADLVDGFLLGNSIRGLTPARLEVTETAASRPAIGYA